MRRPVIAATVVLLAGIAAAHALELSGEIDQRNVDLDEPALTAIVRQLSPGQNNSGASSTVTLNRLRFDFQSTSDGTLVIRNGTVCHDAFAATMDGNVALPGGDLRFNGVLWPAINNAAFLTNTVPLLAPFANNAANASAVPIGLSYQLTGSRTAPILQINPFADEYPGALRRVAESCGGH